MTQKKGEKWAKVGCRLKVIEINEHYLVAAKRSAAQAIPCFSDPPAESGQFRPLWQRGKD